jgi:hypothetical protein
MSFPFFIHRWLISAGRPNENHSSPTNRGQVFYEYVRNGNGDRSAKNCQHQVPDKFADRERVHGIFSFKTKNNRDNEGVFKRANPRWIWARSASRKPLIEAGASHTADKLCDGVSRLSNPSRWPAKSGQPAWHCLAQKSGHPNLSREILQRIKSQTKPRNAQNLSSFDAKPFRCAACQRWSGKKSLPMANQLILLKNLAIQIWMPRFISY